MKPGPAMPPPAAQSHLDSVPVLPPRLPLSGRAAVGARDARRAVPQRPAPHKDFLQRLREAGL